ncbi:GPMC system MBL fold metallohydrolase [Geopsychrobacter electrodiphilus]|uniref:GPMC system MBL fold metallohydrolase n=1 Tax=Geopsychrobacter electrodiphilus TaxID=225196 RepID=UPI00035C4678|nr:GPMC system MBL fold metallohydrolase [Geopsychrobacter electrodiphilus]
MDFDRLTLTILGSGTSTGIPVIGCSCAVCRSEDPRNRRTRCSALLSFCGHNILIDTATDLRQQLLRENIGHIDAVLYTHVHADHLHGIDDLRVFTRRDMPALPLYGAASTLQQIRHNFSYIFDPVTQPGYIPQLKTCPVANSFTLGGLTLIPVPLLHGAMEVFGYRIGPLAYLTDCNGIPKNSLKLLKGLDVLILDGLRLKPHKTHFNVQQAVAMAQEIGAQQTWLTHLSHEIDHPLHEKELPQGIGFAYDGQQISLALPTLNADRDFD